MSHFQLIVPNYDRKGVVPTGPPLSYLRLGTACGSTDSNPPVGHRGDEMLNALSFQDDKRSEEGRTKPGTVYVRSDGVTTVRDKTAKQLTAELLSRGGIREHTDGNRISTTRGDHVEVVGGNYKLLVLGRVVEQADSSLVPSQADRLATFLRAKIAAITATGQSTVNWLCGELGLPELRDCPAALGLKPDGSQLVDGRGRGARCTLPSWFHGGVAERSALLALLVALSGAAAEAAVDDAVHALPASLVSDLSDFLSVYNPHVGPSHWESSGGHNHEGTSWPGECVSISWSTNEDGTWQTVEETTRGDTKETFHGTVEEHFFGPSIIETVGCGSGPHAAETPDITEETYATSITTSLTVKEDIDEQTSASLNINEKTHVRKSRSTTTQAKTVTEIGAFAVFNETLLATTAEISTAAKAKFNLTAGHTEVGLSLVGAQTHSYNGLKFNISGGPTVVAEAAACAKLNLGGFLDVRTGLAIESVTGVSVELKLTSVHGVLRSLLFAARTARYAVLGVKDALDMDIDLNGINLEGCC